MDAVVVVIDMMPVCVADKHVDKMTMMNNHKARPTDKNDNDDDLRLTDGLLRAVLCRCCGSSSSSSVSARVKALT